ncbi:hypothetical protein Ancab_018924 [Ancistrocladus abbreviatus]
MEQRWGCNGERDSVMANGHGRRRICLEMRSHLKRNSGIIARKEQFVKHRSIAEVVKNGSNRTGEGLADHRNHAPQGSSKGVSDLRGLAVACAVEKMCSQEEMGPGNGYVEGQFKQMDSVGLLSGPLDDLFNKLNRPTDQDLFKVVEQMERHCEKSLSIGNGMDIGIEEPSLEVASFEVDNFMDKRKSKCKYKMRKGDEVLQTLQPYFS